MQKLLYIIIVSTIVLAACVGNEKERAALDAAQAIINQRPDSALAILDSLELSSQEFSRSTFRRWQLMRLMAQNKCDTVFRSDSLQLILADYYDRHGTPNEKMWAHYLLGRAYYDMGEAPMAQKAFLDAAEKADTSAADCDYWNLCRVYFQLSNLHYISMLPKEMLSALNSASACAEKSGDTLSVIAVIAKKALVYELSDKQDSVILFAEEAYRQFLRYGQKELACQYLSIAIPPLIKKGNLAKSSEYISLYEENSGYFDDNKNIQEGREIYYHTKGLFYLESEKTDSAERMFRKLLHLTKNINDTHAACMGLRDKYKITGPSDSLIKYAILSEQYDDSLYLSNYRADLQKNEQLYSFTRYLEMSHKYKMESAKRKHGMIMLSLLLLLTILVFAVFYFFKRMRHKTQLLDFKNKIYQLNQLKASNESELVDKEKEIEKLTIQIKELQSSINKDIREDLDNILLESDIVKRVIKTIYHPQKQLTDDVWKELSSLFEHEYPNFQHVLCTIHKISDLEYRVCQLVRIQIPPKCISSLIGFDYNYASTVRKRLHLKILGKEGKPKQFDKFLFSIPRI